MPLDGTVKLTKSSSIDPQDTALEPAVNPPCWGSETAVSLNLTIPAAGVVSSPGGAMASRRRTNGTGVRGDPACDAAGLRCARSGPVRLVRALPAEDGRLWPGGKRAGWNRGHDLATGAPLNRASRDGEIRRRLAAGESVRAVARALRCGLATVQRVRSAGAMRGPCRPGIRGLGGAVSVAGASAAGPQCARYGPVKANYEPAGGFSTTHRLTVRGESPA